MFVRMGLGYHTQYNFSNFSHLPAHFIAWFGFIALRFLVYVYHILLTYASVAWTFRLTWFPRCCVCVLESKHRSSYLPGQDFANWAGSAFSVPLPTSINSVPSPKETKALLGETNAWFDYTHLRCAKGPRPGHCFYWDYEQNRLLTGYCWCKDKARFFEGGTFMSWNPTES